MVASSALAIDHYAFTGGFANVTVDRGKSPGKTYSGGRLGVAGVNEGVFQDSLSRVAYQVAYTLADDIRNLAVDVALGYHAASWLYGFGALSLNRGAKINSGSQWKGGIALGAGVHFSPRLGAETKWKSVKGYSAWLVDLVIYVEPQVVSDE